MPWYIPILIFLSRVADVSIGTIRTILVIRGWKMASALLGFLEVTIWIVAVSSVLAYIRESLWTILAYSGGFATGILVGMAIEQRLAFGQQAIRAINTDQTINLAARLRHDGYAVTDIDGRGVRGPVEICFLVLDRKKVPEAIRKILRYSPNIFLTVEDIRDYSTQFVRSAPIRTPAWKRLIKFK